VRGGMHWHVLLAWGRTESDLHWEISVAIGVHHAEDGFHLFSPLPLLHLHLLYIGIREHRGAVEKGVTQTRPLRVSRPHAAAPIYVAARCERRAAPRTPGRSRDAGSRARERSTTAGACAKLPERRRLPPQRCAQTRARRRPARWSLPCCRVLRPLLD